MKFKAVIFDLGGVILTSPFPVFSHFERQHKLPDGAILSLIKQGGDRGAWAALERGDMDVDTFTRAFAAEARQAGIALDAAGLLHTLGEQVRIEQAMLNTAKKIRRQNLRVGVITNNWDPGNGYFKPMQDFRHEFDLIVESWLIGVRKPHQAIFARALEGLGCAPEEVVFLDDIVSNLHQPRAMGMTTLLVKNPADTILELAGLLSMDLP